MITVQLNSVTYASLMQILNYHYYHTANLPEKSKIRDIYKALLSESGAGKQGERTYL